MWRATKMPRERLRVSGRRAGFPVVILAAGFATSGGDPAPEDAARTVVVFDRTALHFQPDSAAKFVRPGETAADNGRAVRREVDLPELAGGQRITALLVLEPVPKGEREMFDPRDREGRPRCYRGGQEARCVIGARVEMKIYSGRRMPGGTTSVTRADGTPLPPRQDLLDHSAGFE